MTIRLAALLTALGACVGGYLLHAELPAQYRLFDFTEIAVGVDGEDEGGAFTW